MKKPLDFITVISPSGHTSSLSTGVRQDKGNLVVIGGLSHNTEFRPATEADKNKLIQYLNGLKY